MIDIAYDPIVGQRARLGPLQNQAPASYALATAALAASDYRGAADHARHMIQEAVEGYELYAAWAAEIHRYLLREGVDPETLDADEARLEDLIAEPDGTAFDIHKGWAAFNDAVSDIVFACGAGDGAAARRALDAARAVWLTTHDRGCDRVYGMLDIVVRRLGETRIGPLWDELMAPMYETYEVYDTARHPWARSLHRLVVIAAESLRGHLSGPGREGAIEVSEEADRWVLRFDPCGSGGRTYRDAGDAGGPRMEAPYGFAVTTEPHDWSWGKTGVCVYCVHCCQLNQRMPIARFGYPTRVVDPPTWPGARAGTKCTWSIYKDPSLVPAAAYEAVGARKPAA